MYLNGACSTYKNIIKKLTQTHAHPKKKRRERKTYRSENYITCHEPLLLIFLHFIFVCILHEVKQRCVEVYTFLKFLSMLLYNNILLQTYRGVGIIVGCHNRACGLDGTLNYVRYRNASTFYFLSHFPPQHTNTHTLIPKYKYNNQRRNNKIKKKEKKSLIGISSRKIVIVFSEQKKQIYKCVHSQKVQEQELQLDYFCILF